MSEFYSVPDIILKIAYVVGILACVFLAGASLEYRKQRAVKIYLMLMTACGIWLFFNLMTYMVADLETKTMFVRFRFIPLSILPSLWLQFCLELFRKPGEEKKGIGYLAFLIMPIVISVACFVPDMHTLLVHDVRSFLAWNVPAVEWRVGPLVQLHIFFAYVILVMCIVICAKGIKKEGGPHNRYALLMILSISMYSIPELVGIFLLPQVRFLGIPSLTQIPSILFIYSILHKQQVVRTLSSTNDKLFESLPVPALLFNRDKELCLFNSKAVELFNLSIHSAGQKLEEIVPSGVEGQEPTLDALQNSYVCEIIDIRSKEARYFEVNASVIDVQGLFGQKFIMVSFAEVTEIKRHTMMNQRLMSVLSHDLLGNLSGLVTLSNHRHPQHWDLIADTSRSSVDLLKNVLLWTSSRGGFYQCHKEPFDLQELALTVVSQSGSFLVPKELKVQGTLLTEPLVAFVDLKMFSAILRNLLSNAARFSPYNGTIEVNCELKGDYVELTIDDQGPGMSSEVARSILAAEDRPVPNASQGYGIGLFLVQQFVKMHSGQLQVLANKFGGCCMKITFPAVPPSPSPASLDL